MIKCAMALPSKILPPAPDSELLLPRSPFLLYTAVCGWGCGCAPRRGPRYCHTTLPLVLGDMI